MAATLMTEFIRRLDLIQTNAIPEVPEAQFTRKTFINSNACPDFDSDLFLKMHMYMRACTWATLTDSSQKSAQMFHYNLKKSFLVMKHYQKLAGWLSEGQRPGFQCLLPFQHKDKTIFLA